MIALAFVNRAANGPSMTTSVLWELSGEEFVSADPLN